MTTQRTDTGNAIRSALISPNEADSNSEPANVVDGLFAIARAIDHLADAAARIAHGGDGEPTGLEAVSMTPQRRPERRQLALGQERHR